MSPLASWLLVIAVGIACYALAFVPYLAAHRDRERNR